MKKLLSTLLALLVITTSPAGVLAAPAPESGSETAFVILHTNDVHGYYQDTDGAIGHDVLAAYRASLDAPTILISAGDMIQGIYFVNQGKGEAAVNIMNAAGYDAMAVGNHEFDYGTDRLDELAEEASFPFLSQVDGMEHGAILNAGGYKVGVFGVTTPYTRFSSIGALGMDFGTADDILEYAKNMIQALNSEGAEFIIALTHLGTDDNSSLGVDYGTSYALREIDGIDLIVDGHSHTSLEDIIQDGTPIVSTGSAMTAFGQVEVGKSLEITGCKSITKEDMGSVKPDPSVTAVIDKWADNVARAGAEVVSSTDTAVSVERLNERTKETVMGNLVADAMRWAADADIAFENGGAIRAGFDEGDITVGEVNAALPFSNYLCKLKLKGSVVKEALEVSVSSYPEPRGGFLQVSGLTFTFDPAKAVGERVVSISVGGEPLDPNKEYTVVTNDFDARGGDEYTMLKEPFLTDPLTNNSGISAVADAVTEYLNSGSATIGLDGRIKAETEAAQNGAADYTDYVGKTLGVIDGEVYGELADDRAWSGDIRTYTMLGDMLEDIRKGRIGAGITASIACNAIMAEGQYADLDFLPVPKDVYSDKSSAVFKDSGLRDKFNEWVKQAREDGILDEMENRWLSGKLPSNDEIPVIPNDGTDGTLVCAMGTGYPPMTYMGDNNKIVGYQIEVAERFAAFCDMKLRFDDMSYGAILPAIQSGKADFSNMFAITGEREENILFGDVALETTIYFIVKKTDGAAGEDAGKTYEDFIGKQFAVVTGTIFDQIASDTMHSRDTLYFGDEATVFEALKSGKADAVLSEYVLAKIISQKLGGLNAVRLPPDVYYTEIGAISENLELLGQFDAFLDQIAEDGILADIQARWIDNYDYTNPPELPEFPETGSNGELTIATGGMQEPYIFRSGDTYTGIDAEIAARFAASLGKTVRWEVVEFAGLISYVVSGKADMAISGISITEERQKQVHFSKPYSVQYVGLTYRDDNAAENGAGFLNWLKDGVEDNLIQEGRYKLILNGLGVTLQISVLSLICGTIIGSFVCFLLTRRNKFVKGLAKLFCGFIHGTPEVTLLMVAYYIVFGNSNTEGYLVAVAAFSLICGASVASNLSGAIGTVDETEIDSARALGFSAAGAFMKVTLPQAVRRALPGYSEGFVGLVKSTAVVGYIAIQDLTRATDIIRSRTFDAYFSVILSALIYLALTTLLIVILKFIVKKVNGRIPE